MKRILVAIAAAALALPALAQPKDDTQLKRGKYLVQIGGCNDCHTAGYAPSGGKVPEKDWLLGDALGWNGPWGTTYATNLRLSMQDLSEEQWVKKAKSLNARPPMPWFNVRAMTTADLRALYRYIRHLGPAGKPAPAYLAPDKTPPQPYVAFPK
jgi:mono/diheme cytochrome c family protein